MTLAPISWPRSLEDACPHDDDDSCLDKWGIMKLRNPLFAPANSERKVAKALASAADAVILDLEDSVAPAAKEAARAAAAALLTSGSDPTRHDRSC